MSHLQQVRRCFDERPHLHQVREVHTTSTMSHLQQVRRSFDERPHLHQVREVHVAQSLRSLVVRVTRVKALDKLGDVWSPARRIERCSPYQQTTQRAWLGLFITKLHTHPFNGTFSGTTGWAGTRKVKPIWILLKQETASGSGISWAICKSASHSRQITMPVPHHSKVFYRPDALPAAQPTASKHWRDNSIDNNTVFSQVHFSTLTSKGFHCVVSYWQLSVTCEWTPVVGHICMNSLMHMSQLDSIETCE